MDKDFFQNKLEESPPNYYVVTYDMPYIKSHVHWIT